MVLNNKKGFAFSLFAFFLVFLIYGFGTVYFFEGDYDQNSNFNTARILFINNEISYFKDVYVKNVMSYSFYSVLDSLLNYSDNNYVLNKDYTKLNALIAEGLMNGSFNGEAQPTLSNKTISTFIEIFQDNFNKNYRGDFTYNIVNLNIFEKDSYYVSLQVIMSYNITTQDNISEWTINDEFEISIPIFELTDPEFMIQGNLIYPILPAEYYKAGSNWSQQTLNETLIETYSSVYFEPDYKYSIGTSFIHRLLNYSHSSYKDVLNFYSFDHDEEKLGVYDTSLNNELGNHYGNTRVLLNFDNSTANDLSAYENDGVINGATISTDCVSKNCYNFNGVNNYIEFQNTPELEELGDKIKSYSISFWAKANTISINDSIISKSSGLTQYPFLCQISLLNLECSIKDNLGSTYTLNSEASLNDSKFHHYIFNVVESKGLELYMDGILVAESYIQLNNNYSNTLNTFIGSKDINNNHFSGLIDEVAIYSKELNSEEVANIFTKQKAQFIDYKDSLYGRGILYDGIDDYTELNDKLDFSNQNFSIEVWFNRNSNTGTSDFLIGKKDQSQKEWYFDFDNNKIRFNMVNTTNSLTSVSSVLNVENNKWNYVVVTYNTSIPEMKLYVNSVPENLKQFKGLMTNSNLNLTLGSDFNLSNNFNGVFDEIKLYNKTLTDNEIKINYYNYQSSAKGCCNYLTLINPNKMGYNISSTYDGNISYSSKLFYDYYKRGFNFNNISLVKLQNFTSNITSSNYYNFNSDFCMMNAYNMFDYGGLPTIVEGENNTMSCKNLIQLGVY